MNEELSAAKNVNKETDKKRVQITLRLDDSTFSLIKKLYKDDNCMSQNEFIEKAVLFYCGYLSTNDSGKYLPNIITSTLKGIVDESDNRISRMLFKMSVEMAIMMNVIAAGNDIDKTELNRLRGSCVEEVKRLNGSFCFDDAVRWQRE